MTTLEQLTGAHRRTYEKLFHQTASAKVQFRSVRALLESIGQVADIATDRLQVTRNGHVLILVCRKNWSAVPADERLALQHFLKRSENPPPDTSGRKEHQLLVIGRLETRVFRSEVFGGSPQLDFSRPAQPAFAEPGESAAPAADAYFEPIAQSLHLAGKILIFGESSATQLEMDRFVEWLKQKHPDLAARIVGSLVLEHDQANPDLLLAKARQFYAFSGSTSPL